MTCGVCGGKEALHDTRDVPYTHQGEQTMLPAIEGDFCPTCGEISLDMTNANRIVALMREFDRQATPQL